MENLYVYPAFMAFSLMFVYDEANLILGIRMVVEIQQVR